MATQSPTQPRLTSPNDGIRCRIMARLTEHSHRWIGVGLTLMVVAFLAFGTATGTAHADGPALQYGQDPGTYIVDPSAPADVRDAANAVQNAISLLREARGFANNAVGYANTAGVTSRSLMADAQSCYRDSYYRDLQEFESQDGSATTIINHADLWGSLAQNLIDSANTKIASVSDAKLQAQLSGDLQAYADSIQGSFKTQMQQARQTLAAAEKTAADAQSIYNTKCRPILEPQASVPVDQTGCCMLPPIGFNLKPLKSIVCSDGSVWWVPDGGFSDWPTLQGCPTLSTGPQPTYSGSSTGNGAATGTTGNGSTSGSGGSSDAPVKTQTNQPTSPTGVVPGAPKTPNSSSNSGAMNVGGPLGLPAEALLIVDEPQRTPLPVSSSFTLPSTLTVPGLAINSVSPQTQAGAHMPQPATQPTSSVTTTTTIGTPVITFGR